MPRRIWSPPEAGATSPLRVIRPAGLPLHPEFMTDTNQAALGSTLFGIIGEVGA